MGGSAKHGEITVMNYVDGKCNVLKVSEFLQELCGGQIGEGRRRLLHLRERGNTLKSRVEQKQNKRNQLFAEGIIFLNVRIIGYKSRIQLCT